MDPAVKLDQVSIINNTRIIYQFNKEHANAIVRSIVLVLWYSDECNSKASLGLLKGGPIFVAVVVVIQGVDSGWLGNGCVIINSYRDQSLIRSQILEISSDGQSQRKY